MRKPGRAEYTDNIPNIRKLVDMWGAPETSLRLGLSDIATMLREGKARPAYEMAAAYLLGQNSAKERTLLVHVSTDDEVIVMGLLDRLGVRYSEIKL